MNNLSTSRAGLTLPEVDVTQHSGCNLREPHWPETEFGIKFAIKDQNGQFSAEPVMLFTYNNSSNSLSVRSLWISVIAHETVIIG